MRKTCFVISWPSKWDVAHDRSVSTYLQKSLFVNGDGEGECDTLNLNYDNKYIIN